MNINTSKSVKYLIGLCVAGLFACGVYVSLAYANVCFLPSGICDFGESEVHEFVFTEPQGECTGDIEQDKSKCCLLSPLPYFKCEQCDNGRFKCEEQCINNDFQLITKHGTRRSECVCKGDACGSIPTANNNKDLRDKHCSVLPNSCGLCPEGKCVCNGEKCSDKNNGNKIYACTTSKTNNCGNCPTDRGASCECVNCCDVFGTDWYSDSDRKCKLINHTKNNSTCYKPYDCTCPEEFPGSQKGDDCPTGQMADFISNAENGDACYKCRSKSCADYSDNNVTYHESYSDRNETCQDYETVRLNDRTCYVYTNRSCEVVYAGYSGASLFLNNANLREGYSDCYSFTEKQDCKNYVGSCFLGRKKSCTERGLLSSQPSGKVCDAISACDMTCFDPNTCRVPGPGCIENGGKFNKSELDCDEACIIETSFPQDEGKPCFMCEAGCDPCKKINSAYRSSANDPCENGQCCQGKWSEVTDDSAIGSRKCYKCKSCEEISSNYHTGQVTDCKTQNIKVSNTNGCYVCPNCFQYGVVKRVYSINASKTKYPAYQENQCGADKIQIEVPDTNRCYQCPSCSEFNSQWQSESSCTDGKVAKPVIGHTQCKKCVKCPDNTWTTNKPSSGEYSTWTDEDTGFTCYKSGTCADYSQEESASACDSNKCYKAKEQDHNGLKCYTCTEPRTCEELWGSEPEYAQYSIYDGDQNNLECKKVQSCDRDCWACQTCDQVNSNYHTGSQPSRCDTGEDEKVDGTKNCYKCKDSAPTCATKWGSTMANYPAYDIYDTPQTCKYCLEIRKTDDFDKVCYACRECPPTAILAFPHDNPAAQQTEIEYRKWKLVENCDETPTCNGNLYIQTLGYGGECKYYFCEADKCTKCGDLGLSDADECEAEGKQAIISPGNTAQMFDHFEWVNGKKVEVCTPTYCYECKTCPAPYKNAFIGTEQVEYDCPEGTVARTEEVNGAVCYTCKDIRCSSKGSSYIETSETCPDNKPNPEDEFDKDLDKFCRHCTDCPVTLPYHADFNELDDLDESILNDPDFQADWKNEHNGTPLTLEYFNQYKNKQCCSTCKAKDGKEHCRTGDGMIINKGEVCENTCEALGFVTSCPQGTRPYRRLIPSINQWCINECKPVSSSGGGGGGGGSDSYSDSSCRRCCVKSSDGGVTMRTAAPSECLTVCNAGNCCYATPGNDHEGNEQICDVDEIANSGSCNPMDLDSAGMYFHCPQGSICSWDGGSAPSTQGHCTGSGSETVQTYPPDAPSSPCNNGSGCQGSKRICCVRGNVKTCVETPGQCKPTAIVDPENPCSNGGEVEDDSGNLTGGTMPCGEANCSNMALLCECLNYFRHGGMSNQSDCNGFETFFDDSNVIEYANQCSSCGY